MDGGDVGDADPTRPADRIRVRPRPGSRGPVQRRLEREPATPGRLHRGKYSEGLDRLPESERKRHPGRFSDGLAQFPDDPRTARHGSFGDREPPFSPGPSSRAALRRRSARGRRSARALVVAADGDVEVLAQDGGLRQRSRRSRRGGAGAARGGGSATAGPEAPRTTAAAGSGRRGRSRSGAVAWVAVSTPNAQVAEELGAPGVDLALGLERVARVQIERDVEALDRRPEIAVALVVVVRAPSENPLTRTPRKPRSRTARSASRAASAGSWRATAAKPAKRSGRVATIAASASLAARARPTASPGSRMPWMPSEASDSTAIAMPWRSMSSSRSPRRDVPSAASTEVGSTRSRELRRGVEHARTVDLPRPWPEGDRATTSPRICGFLVARPPAPQRPVRQAPPSPSPSRPTAPDAPRAGAERRRRAPHAARLPGRS